MMVKKLIFLQICLLTFVVRISAAPSRSEKSFAALVPNYDLAVKIQPEAQRLEVAGSVQLPAVNSQQELIPLLLSDQMRDFRVEVIKPAASAGIAKVEAKGSGGGRSLYVVIPVKPIGPGEPVLLRFSYVGGEKGAFVFHLGTEGSFAHGSLSAWYPLLDAGGYTGHTGKLKFSVPAGQVVVASGKSISTAPQIARGDYYFEVTQPAVFSFAAAKYTIARRSDKPP